MGAVDDQLDAEGCACGCAPGSEVAPSSPVLAGPCPASAAPCPAAIASAPASTKEVAEVATLSSALWCTYSLASVAEPCAGPLCWMPPRGLGTPCTAAPALKSSTPAIVVADVVAAVAVAATSALCSA
eukprot:scaffold130366_cov21-Tisochrysis_lutea.AAC.1